MNVTQHNFDECLTEMRENIFSNSCQFIAIDTEFTGLSSNNDDREMYLDTLEERYNKVKASGENFIITQFGLATVHIYPENHAKENYEIKVWNCYIFPRAYGYADCRFLCQASSLQFLATHGFDFNKCIYDGIPYCKLSKLSEMKRRLEGQIKRLDQSQATNTGPLQLDEQGKKFQKEIIAKIKEWIESPDRIEGQAETKLLLAASNSYQRKIIYSTVDDIDASLTTDQVEVGIETWYATSSEIEELRANKAKKMRAEMEEKIGFSRVIEAISNSKKPIVGHNALLDFIYIYHRFCAPLPDTLNEFKVKLLQLFPNIYDTKILASESVLYHKMKSTSLSAVFDYMCDRLSATPSDALFSHQSVQRYRDAMGAQERNKEQTQLPCHEAGYDAMMTAVCFVGILSHDFESGKFLNNCLVGHTSKKRRTKKRRKNTGNASQKAQQMTPSIDSRMQILESWKNKIYLMASDGKFLDLTDCSQIIDRSRVYHVHSAKRKIQELCLDKMFEPCKVQVKRVFLEGTQNAFVILSDNVCKKSLPKIKLEISLDAMDKQPENVENSSIEVDELQGVVIKTYGEYMNSKQDPKPASPMPTPEKIIEKEPEPEIPEKKVEPVCNSMPQKESSKTLWESCTIS